MVEVNLDERISKLEQIIENQQKQIQFLEEDKNQQDKKIQRLKDIHEIQNLMGRYVTLHEVGMLEMLNFFAQETPGVTVEVANYGVFEGLEGAKKAYAREPQRGASPGWMVMHPLTTPIIEVAGDGKTAKGVWISPGHETGQKPDGEFEAFWAWTKYGVDFVKEGDRWKVWHYHVYGIFRTPFDQCWTEEFEFKIDRPIIDTGAPKPDKPTTYDNRYNRKYLAKLIPEPPRPYETFDPKSAY